VFHQTVNKWHGLTQVAALLGLDVSRLVAVGDDVNDIAMLKHARIGVAMGNARPGAIAVADRVIGTNDQDALADLIDSLLEEAAQGRATRSIGSG